jgi:hypothetical protein
MRNFFLAAVMLSGTALAADPTEVAFMVKQCKSPMGQGICRVMNTAVQAKVCEVKPDPQACRLEIFRQRYPNGLIVAGANGGRFTAEEYFRYMDAGEKMCELIIADAENNPAGFRMARALWRHK